MSGFSEGTGGVRQDDGRLCGALVEVAREPLRLVCFVGSEIVCPTEADGLVLKLCADVEGAGCGGNVVACGGAAADEGGILERFALNGDVGRGGDLLSKPAGRMRLSLR